MGLLFWKLGKGSGYWETAAGPAITTGGLNCNGQLRPHLAGEIDTEFLTADPRYPFGVRTDYAQLAQAVWDAEERLIVVDLGILSAVICTRSTSYLSSGRQCAL